jgi:hypothetical protein
VIGCDANAQKHNPFVYTNNVATDPARLAKTKPFDHLTVRKTELSNPKTAALFHHDSRERGIRAPSVRGWRTKASGVVP